VRLSRLWKVSQAHERGSAVRPSLIGCTKPARASRSSADPSIATLGSVSVGVTSSPLVGTHLHRLPAPHTGALFYLYRRRRYLQWSKPSLW